MRLETEAPPAPSPVLLPPAGLATVAGAPGRTLQIPENPPGAQPCAPPATGGVPEQRDLCGEGSVGVWVTHTQWGFRCPHKSCGPASPWGRKARSPAQFLDVSRSPRRAQAPGCGLVGVLGPLPSDQPLPPFLGWQYFLRHSGSPAEFKPARRGGPLPHPQTPHFSAPGDCGGQEMPAQRPPAHRG